MKGQLARLRRAVAVAGVGALTLALAGPATGSVQTGSSGWQWGNPLPQGNTIHAMAFSGLNGYAVGGFGTVLSTIDGGSTWTGRKSGTATDLTEVQAISATAFFAGGGCVGRLSSDAGATFTRVAFTPVESSCSQALAAAWFVSPTSGFLALSDGTMITTADGGTSFGTRTAVPGTTTTGGTARPTDLLFFSATEGLASTDDGHVYRTTDGAQTWSSVATFGQSVRALLTAPTLLPGGTSVYAVGAGGLVRESVDNGVTWSPANRFTVPGGVTLTGGSCPGPLLCMFTTLTAGGEPSQTLIRWVQGVLPPGDVTEITPSGVAVNAIAFASSLRAVVAGVHGSTALSDNAGLTFTTVGTAIPGSYLGVVAGPGSTAFAYGESGVLATSADAGATWTKRNVPTGSDIIGASFTSALAGYALAEDGGLFKTTDGGLTWRTLDTGTTTPANAVLAVDAATVFVVGPSKSRASVDGGETFEVIGALKKKKTGGIFDIAAAGDSLFAWGGSTLWTSSDVGDTWKQVLLPPKGSGCVFGAKCTGVSTLSGYLGRVNMVSAKQGWVVGWNDRLFRTTNGGKSWTWIAALGNDVFEDIAFSSATSGYVTGSVVAAGNELVQRTSDGGKTWALQVVAAEPVAGIATSSVADYLLAGTDGLLFTTTGGQAGASSTLAVSTSKTSLSKAKTITINGTLSPAKGNREVVVEFLPAGSSGWEGQVVKTASNGKFTAKVKVKKGVNLIVAQWSGDESLAGAGTKPLQVTVG